MELELLEKIKEYNTLTDKIKETKEKIYEIFEEKVLDNIAEKLKDKNIDISKCSTEILAKYLITFTDQKTSKIFIGLDLNLEKSKLIFGFTTSQYNTIALDISDDFDEKELINIIMDAKLQMLQWKLDFESGKIKLEDI